MADVQKVQRRTIVRQPIIRKVGAYCRVSTQLETQQMSLESQMVSFRQKIESTPGWKLAGIYADEGITGTSVKKRPQFLKMIEDAEYGKIDTIITKSISRFARNTVECLEYSRKLKAIGVNIYFEKEGLDTAFSASEMLLTVLAAFAQEESRSISENLKWGIRKRYEMGLARWTPLYGFRLNKDRKIVIDPTEAQTVQMIFNSYRKGIALPAIVDYLNQDKIPSPRGKRWTVTVVLGILRNERYVGDIHLQKWISTDHLSHHCIPNDGSEVPQYYVKNNHTPIIDRRSYDQVQRILELKAPRGEITRYPYNDTKIICPYCGKPMIPRQMHVQKEKKAICCFSEEGCHHFSVKTWILDEVLRAAFEKVNMDDITGNGDGARRMREAKKEGTPETIEYWFLADLVRKITFDGRVSTKMQKHKKGPATIEKVYYWDVTIFWQCSLSTTLPLPMDQNHTEEPTHVAELYESFLIRVHSGKYIPARPKSIFEKELVNQKRSMRNGGKDDHTGD